MEKNNFSYIHKTIFDLINVGTIYSSHIYRMSPNNTNIAKLTPYGTISLVAPILDLFFFLLPTFIIATQDIYRVYLSYTIVSSGNW